MAKGGKAILVTMTLLLFATLGLGSTLNVHRVFAQGLLCYSPEVEVQSNPEEDCITCSPNPTTVGSPSVCTASEYAIIPPVGTVYWSSGDPGVFSSISCALAPVLTTESNCQVEYTPSNAFEYTSSNASSPVAIIVAVFNTTEPQPSYPFPFYYDLGVSKAHTNVSVVCSPSQVSTGQSTTCKANVSGYVPSGAMSWTANSVVRFSPPACTLASQSCSVTCYTPFSSSLPIIINASYSGDESNWASSGNFSLSVMSQPSTSVTTATVTVSTVETTTMTVTTRMTASELPYQLVVIVLIVLVAVLVAVLLALLGHRNGRRSRRSTPALAPRAYAFKGEIR
jgi:hypothetical protein